MTDKEFTDYCKKKKIKLCGINYYNMVEEELDELTEIIKSEYERQCNENK